MRGDLAAILGIGDTECVADLVQQTLEHFALVLVVLTPVPIRVNPPVVQRILELFTGLGVVVNDVLCQQVVFLFRLRFLFALRRARCRCRFLQNFFRVDYGVGLIQHLSSFL